MSAAEQWGPVARRGECRIHIMTRARAVAEGLGPCLHREGVYLGTIIPDDGDAVHMNFTSAEFVALWLREMQPHGVTVAVASDEDEAAIFAALAASGVGATVH